MSHNKLIFPHFDRVGVHAAVAPEFPTPCEGSVAWLWPAALSFGLAALFKEPEQEDTGP